MSTALTKEILIDFMKDLAIPAKPEHREFYVHTGVQGMELFNEAMKKQVRIDSALRDLVLARSMNRLTKQEADTVRAMIHSPDEDNLLVAEAILEEKTKR